ncbi:MAG TPA: glycerol-3-phosphate 1-O-acyltransferase PlsY [Kofleriaceae bacterium]|nr:glycerol-3-phosphate 1-O-acyltransferase PlsY [Kofleriaceae bacterium]
MTGSLASFLAAGGLVVAAYLLGSIPTGYLVGRHRGVDVRQQGSGNIGATNVARTLGRKLGILVLFLDALKGAAPVALWRLADIGPRLHLGGPLAPYVFTAFGLAPIIGHCFPVWLRFRGGKGVATALGVFLVADPLVVLIGVAVFAVLYTLTRIVSIGSLSASLVIPTAAALLGRPWPVVALAAGGAVLIIGKHHQNIRRLLRRRELKV